MENRLENLKEKMDETILKDVYFDDKQYQKVLNSIKKSKFQKQVFPLKNKFNTVLSFSVVSLMFLGITYFVGTQLNLFNGPEVKQANEPKENMQESLEPSNEKTAYIPPKQEENYDEMTKEEILTKMINTVDYFETAIGEFKSFSGGDPGSTVIEYAISLKNQPGGYGKRTYTENGKNETFYEYFKDGTVWNLIEQTHTYRQMSYSEGSSSGTLKIEDAFSKDNEGINVTKYRERPPIGSANETLFPYEIASNYTRDLSKWEIEKQNEELLGHNTIVIKGTKNHRDFQSFRFWVDKDTGILVKYETYNSAGDVVDYLYPSKLEINVPINSEQFIPNLDGYRIDDLSEKPSITTGNIDELIPEELKAQWEESKKNPNETAILHFNNKWYIHVKRGYLVNYVDEEKGILYFAKASAAKSLFNFHALAEGYNVETLKMVYE